MDRKQYKLSPEAIEQRRKAGKARQSAMAEPERKEFARTGAAVRWADNHPEPPREAANQA